MKKLQLDAAELVVEQFQTAPAVRDTRATAAAGDTFPNSTAPCRGCPQEPSVPCVE
jgi:hypothetical protein